MRIPEIMYVEEERGQIEIQCSFQNRSMENIEVIVTA